MGCDIHACIEYSPKKGRASADGSKYWFSFATINHIRRDYLLFGVLAGVRSDFEPVVPRRGVPEDANWGLLEEYTLRVVEDAKDKNHECTKEEAGRWGNKWFDADHSRVINPDWHSASWVDAEELERALLAYTEYGDTSGSPTVEAPRDMLAILSAMHILSQDNEVRLVFWFDN